MPGVSRDEGGAQANRRATPNSRRRPLPSLPTTRSQPEPEDADQSAVAAESSSPSSDTSSEDDEPAAAAAAAADVPPPPPTSMAKQEAAWWAMSFEELFQYAREYYRTQGHAARGAPRWKSGRVRIIKWLCDNHGIRQYVAPSRPARVDDDAPPVDQSPVVRPTGAISHPEAILRTSDPELQQKIAQAAAGYRKWPATALVELAMQRSYQLLKDSHGKLPSKSVAAISDWLAAWDVLKSEREKKWWLGDGIDLVNKAKAIGYEGSSKKYDVILWLRNTPEEVDGEIEHVAAPTDNKAANEKKRKAEREGEGEGEPVKTQSKRPAKGSMRPGGWQATPGSLKSKRQGQRGV
ncbi:uncharacterized protein L3040_008566 [Drepanopeziza brunnea f. sp. 'multigermtubi']|uniref:Uncharacterized protein n=1 Tax=Marssonina brunnea f. sp. multigermtubi (strain MB_m1) TaxID=1072389 RepID=K1Y1G1_MARBU|nr:uncharacterized protein MBM_03221 [Drepanopeziza brunnea f. sp. 'multigermtubi' MB_m1]EKD18979.1 hypothetical protein MBM_03221 [Drepanopeziza brunnea f. sp. 'multigermtubi' MB_m1]KAJ5033451.1 hypothetical protein L3040_008566 [Drepanopeziza brunnea f. sp. 'multigermtubi']